MDLLSFIIGIVIGAAFSPFWMMVWARIKDLYQSKTQKPVEAADKPVVSEPVVSAPAKKATRQRRAKPAE